ncbi:hypothetical protein LCGC14_1539100 [marine sediment metagenome]|uniref:Uncharacterized protein n=1 Tax=marine sediment metagenome TaxID=412755 RepID=A0A0F9L9Q7_9ZZZZ
MKQINKEYLKLNKNLLLSIVFSMAISAMVAQLLAGQETYLNSTFTIITGYVVFFSSFGALYYFGLRKKYEILQKNKNLKNELKRLIASLGIGEIFYLAIRWSTLYHFLNIGIEPYLASLISEAISLASYMLIVTISAKLTGLYKES